MSFSRELRVLQARFHRPDRALEQIVAELLQLRAGELFLDVLRPGLVGGDERKVDLVFLRGGERDLRLLGLFLDALDGVGLLAEVDAGVLS